MVAWEILKAQKTNADSNIALSILAGGERLARYRAEGFVVNGDRCDFEYREPRGTKPFDFVIVACKNHHLPKVISDLAGHIGPGTLILSLLNGISSEQEIGAAFGKTLPYAMIIGTDAGHGGNETTFSTPGTIFFGQGKNSGDRGKWSPDVAAIADFFDRAGVPYAVPEDMLNRLWYKYMLNVGVNQVTATLRRSYKIMQTGSEVVGARDLVEGAMREVIAIAKAEGIALGDDDIASVWKTMDKLDPAGKTSMCQDVEAGRKTEVELFSGKVIELAKRHGIAVPVNELLWKMLRVIEASY